MVLLGFALGAVGCSDDETEGRTEHGGAPEEDGSRVHGLTPEQAAQTLAKIGSTEITVGAFANELSSKGSFVRTRYSSPERRREFLDQMIRFELLAQEAARRGLDQLPEVERSRKQILIRRFLEERFDHGGPETVSMGDVREYYESHPTEFHTPEQVRASHIQMQSRATAERVLRELQQNPGDQQLYRRLVAQHHTDSSTAESHGDLGFFSRPEQRTESEPEIPAAIANAAFALEQIGQYAPEVVESEAGFHVVKLTGRRAAMHRSLEEAARPIRNRLWRERREAGIEALISELRAEADVEENLDLLQQVRLELPEGDSPRLPNPQPHGGSTRTRPSPAGGRR